MCILVISWLISWLEIEVKLKIIFDINFYHLAEITMLQKQFSSQVQK